MRQLLLLLISITVLFSCTQNQQSTTNNLITADNLVSQLFSVNINADTTLVTRQGCIIRIPKGSLQSDSSNVKLEIKEALSNTDIVLAGLSTMAGKQPLSSGGMIYFNAAAGYKLQVKKQLEILVPTKNYNREMKIFKGQQDSSGNINWVDPAPLPQDETTKKIDAGKEMFIANCATCHKINEEFVGPALHGITEKRSKHWLEIYTRHRFSTGLSEATRIPERLTDTTKQQVYYHDFLVEPEITHYHQCRQNKYSKEMTAFPALTNQDIDAIYAYVKIESGKRPDLDEKAKDNCCDSCVTYQNAKMKIEGERQQFIQDNEDFFTLERAVPVPPVQTIAPAQPATTPQPAVPNTKVSRVNAKAVYYTITIQAVGWYNIDILLKEYSNCIPSELMVQIQGDIKTDLNVTLIIPSVKAFIEGGKLKDGAGYGFDEEDGRINLPQGTACTILAFGEDGDGVLFGKATFNAQTKQLISVSAVKTTRENLKQEIINLGLDNVSIDIKNSKNAGEIRNTDKKLQQIEKLKPVSCDCDINYVQSSPKPAENTAAIISTTPKYNYPDE